MKIYVHNYTWLFLLLQPQTIDDHDHTHTHKYIKHFYMPFRCRMILFRTLSIELICPLFLFLVSIQTRSVVQLLLVHCIFTININSSYLLHPFSFIAIVVNSANKKKQVHTFVVYFCSNRLPFISFCIMSLSDRNASDNTILAGNFAQNQSISISMHHTLTNHWPTFYWDEI